MQKITPCLWFNFNADEALELYKSIFPDFKLISVNRYDASAGENAGKVFVAEIELMGSRFQMLNAGPTFKFTEAISLSISCKGQEEVDYYWDKLTADGGEESQCGWLKDKFGLSWQVVPVELMQLFNHKDKGKAGRAMQAMMKQKKIIIQELEDAAAGAPA